MNRLRKKIQHISNAVIRRLPRYYRVIAELEQEGEERISSGDLARRTGLTASQIRQDLNHFGGFGQQGYGYNVRELKNELRQLLGLGRTYSLIIMGAGNIGTALSQYGGFAREGFRVSALFDADPTRVRAGDPPVLPAERLEEYLRENPADIAVLTVPVQAAQATADRLCAAGVKNIWNFAPCDLTVPAGAVLESVNLSDSLYQLSYRMEQEARTGRG